MTIQKNNAFTLIELVLALTLFAISSIVMVGFLTTTGVWACKAVRAMQADVVNAVALDLVARDIMSASSNPRDWDIEHCVFKQEKVDAHGIIHKTWVGWDVAKKGLRRREGNYDCVHHVWQQVTTSMVACAMREFKLVPSVSRDGAIIAVRVVCDQARTVRLTHRTV